MPCNRPPWRASSNKPRFSLIFSRLHLSLRLTYTYTPPKYSVLVDFWETSLFLTTYLHFHTTKILCKILLNTFLNTSVSINSSFKLQDFSSYGPLFKIQTTKVQIPKGESRFISYITNNLLFMI